MYLGCHPVTHRSPARLTWIVAAPPTWSYTLPLIFSLSSTCSQSQPASEGRRGPLPTEHPVAPTSPAVKGRVLPSPPGLGLPPPPAPPLAPLGLHSCSVAFRPLLQTRWPVRSLSALGWLSQPWLFVFASLSFFLLEMPSPPLALPVPTF